MLHKDRRGLSKVIHLPLSVSSTQEKSPLYAKIAEALGSGRKKRPGNPASLQIFLTDVEARVRLLHLSAKVIIIIIKDTCIALILV
jgi:hypothetical protein